MEQTKSFAISDSMMQPLYDVSKSFLYGLSRGALSPSMF